MAVTKRIKAGSIEEAKKVLGTDQVTSLGGGTFTGNSPEAVAPTIQTFSRPTGTPVSQNVETTNMTPQQKNEISTQNAVIGQQLKASADNQTIQQKYNEAIQSVGQQNNPNVQAPLAQNIESLQNNIAPIPTPFQKGVDVVSQATELIKQGDFKGANALGQGQPILKASLQSAVSILQNVRALSAELTGLGGKDTARVKDAREIMNRNNAFISDEISQIKLGKDPSEAISSIYASISANNVLYSDAKGKGLASFKYWLSGGADLEQEALDNSRQLQRLLDELNSAIAVRRATLR